MPWLPFRGGPVILVAEHDWRTRRFICTLLQYFTHACVIECSSADDALLKTETAGRAIDVLISNVELNCETGGVALGLSLTAVNPELQVLLMSGRCRPPVETPSGWLFLSIPFPTDVFLNRLHQLCRSLEPPVVSASNVRHAEPCRQALRSDNTP